MNTSCECRANTSSTPFYNNDNYVQIDVEIDNNLYSIIIEWVRNGRKFGNKDELITNILNEYEDRYFRPQHNNTPQSQPQLFKHKILHNRRYTTNSVCAQLHHIFDTNRYHVKSLVTVESACPCCEPCGSCCGVNACINMNVDDYIKNLIKNNYEQSLVGLNKTSILMSLPSYINRQEFETKMKTICDSDATSYKLRQDLEVL